MLELRPNCECCDKDLAPASAEAMICSYECTFCSDCVSDVLQNVCPNCGGGFVERPIRPQTDRRPGVGLASQPASDRRVNTPYSREQISAFARDIRSIPPAER